MSALETDEGLLVSAAIRDVTERIEAQTERDRLTAQPERERLESQLHQSQRLESLGQLAGGVAHDFNNLLGVIINYADFIGEEVAAAITRWRRDWVGVQRDVEQIQSAADRAAELAHQLLAFARREVTRPEVLSLNDVVNDVERLLRRIIGEHVELDTSLLARAVAGARRQGADRASAGQPVRQRPRCHARRRWLSIETDNVVVDEAYAAGNPGAQLGRRVRLRVSDTGAGMDPDVRRRAFEPFFTTKAEGRRFGPRAGYRLRDHHGSRVAPWTSTRSQAWARPSPLFSRSSRT